IKPLLTSRKLGRHFGVEGRGFQQRRRQDVADAGYRDVLVPVLETSALGRHRRVALESDLCVIQCHSCLQIVVGQQCFANKIDTERSSRHGEIELQHSVRHLCRTNGCNRRTPWTTPFTCTSTVCCKPNRTSPSATGPPKSTPSTAWPGAPPTRRRPRPLRMTTSSSWNWPT